MNKLICEKQEVSSMSSKKVFALLFVFLFIIILAGCGGGGSNDPTLTSSNSQSGGGTGETGGSADTGGGSATGVASLTWIAPTTNPDGTQITDLMGFKVYYGTASRTYTHTIDVQNVTSYTINNLPAGTYYFAITAYYSVGNSDYSNEISKTVP
jgi:hypothetical protein